MRWHFGNGERERERDRRAPETVEEREIRLSKRRTQDRKRASEFRASETAAEREITYSKLYTCNSSTHAHCIMTTYTCFSFFDRNRGFHDIREFWINVYGER